MSEPKSEFLIESGVGIPVKNDPMLKWREFANRMKENESIFLGNNLVVANYLIHTLRNLGFNASYISEGKGFRVFKEGRIFAEKK